MGEDGGGVIGSGGDEFSYIGDAVDRAGDGEVFVIEGLLNIYVVNGAVFKNKEEEGFFADGAVIDVGDWLGEGDAVIIGAGGGGEIGVGGFGLGPVDG